MLVLLLVLVVMSVVSVVGFVLVSMAVLLMFVAKISAEVVVWISL